MEKFYEIHSFWDLIIAPLYYIILQILVYNVTFKLESDIIIRRYLRIHFLLKNLVAILLVAFMWHRYGYIEDMGFYYLKLKKITSVLDTHDLSFYDLYFKPEYFSYISGITINHIGKDVTSTLPLLMLPIYFLSKTSILGMIVMLNFFIFLSSTYLYRVFIDIFPSNKKEALISIFWLPSVIIWVGGIYKDTLAYIGLSFVVYCAYKLLIKNIIKLKYLVGLIFFSYLILITKPHILIVFVFIFIWVLRNYLSKFSLELKIMSFLFFMFLFYIFSNNLINYISQSQLDAAKFTDVEKVTKIVDGFNNYYSDSKNQGGSQYSLGAFDPSLSGLIRLFPAGFIVTFFRPFMWELRSPVLVLNVLESLVLLFAAFYILYKRGLRIFSIIISNNFLTFCLFFSFILGAIIGIMSFNFGTLARYKTPVMPFFAFMVLVLFKEVRNKVKNSHTMSKV